MSESSVDAAARLGSVTAHEWLRGLSALLCAVGVVVVGLAVRRARSLSPFAPRPSRGLALAWIWSAFFVTVLLFSYAVNSVQPRGYYSGLLGPDWIIMPILVSSVLAVPLAVLVVCSFLERTGPRLFTKINVLVLVYVYGAYLVAWTTVPGDVPMPSDASVFRYVGPRIHAALILSSFALEYAFIRGAPRLVRRVLTGDALANAPLKDDGASRHR